MSNFLLVIFVDNNCHESNNGLLYLYFSSDHPVPTTSVLEEWRDEFQKSEKLDKMNKMSFYWMLVSQNSVNYDPGFSEKNVTISTDFNNYIFFFFFFLTNFKRGRGPECPAPWIHYWG